MVAEGGLGWGWGSVGAENGFYLYLEMICSHVLLSRLCNVEGEVHFTVMEEEEEPIMMIMFVSMVTHLSGD